MTYALVLRKLVINDNIYYQIIDKVIGESDNNSILVIEGDNFINTTINSIDSLDDIVYLEINKDIYYKFNEAKTVFLKNENNELVNITDLTEENNVVLAFYKKFKDFKILPDYDILKIVNEAKQDILKKVIGQDQVVTKILNKIYNNYMYYDTELDDDELYKNKSNVLVMGPKGSGKTTIKNNLLKCFAPIPIISYQITGNYNQDIKNIIQKLLMQVDGNRFLAMRGIVIFDNINSMNSNFTEDDLDIINLNLEVIKRILNSRMIYLKDQNNNTLAFDCSLLTTICFIDVDYNKNNEVDKENTYYSLASDDSLAELGFEEEFLEHFDDEIIYMNEMTKDLAKQVLQNKEISPLYQYKVSLEKLGKKVNYSNEFVENLIDFGLDLDSGFSGILKTFKQVVQSKDINDKVISFTLNDILNLSIGTYLPSYDMNAFKENKIDEQLNVDLKKKTINNKTLKETVNLIKENIKGQDEQVFAIVNAFYKHIFNRQKGFSKFELTQLKENVLLIGSTGVGKTAIVENLARIFDLPYKREIAPRYSKSGYVGESVDSIITDLIEVAKGDIKKAQNGIIFLDEVDKISASGDKTDMGLAVQNELLTLIEGDNRSIDDKKSYSSSCLEFDTSNLLIYAAGAFNGLEEIIKKRVKNSKVKTVGFQNNAVNEEIITTTTPEDLVEFGMDRQFIARLPNIVNLNNLNEDILYEIINSKEGYVNLNKKSYAFDGVEIEMSETFKRNLAKKAFLDKKGARSIKTIFSRIKNEIDQKIMNDEYQKVILNDNCLDDYKKIVYVKRKK